MKFFVSGKVGNESDAQQLMSLLRQAGHEITFDWTTIAHLRPYDQNAKASREAALLETRGVKQADVLIIIANDMGIGMFVELGIAIGAGIPVRVVTTSKDSRTMFFHHPLVKQVTDINEIVREFS
jgi:nucleoside 2-deoxyribosyltransferase